MPAERLPDLPDLDLSMLVKVDMPERIVFTTIEDEEARPERALIDAILAELPMTEDGTGHVAGCGYDETATPTCGCYTLPERLARVIAQAKAEALAPVLALAEQLSEWDYLNNAVAHALRHTLQDMGYDSTIRPAAPSEEDRA